MTTMTQRIAGATAERANQAAHVAGECAAHAETYGEIAALAEAVLLLAKAEKLLKSVATGAARTKELGPTKRETLTLVPGTLRSAKRVA